MEIPHFAALRGTERELVILRSETGESWREHHCEHTEEELNQILNGMDEGETGHMALSAQHCYQSKSDLQFTIILHISGCT